ncbi:hypothetical protein [Microbispora sp. H10830]|uniref:hypothetical protein n=1 Tax=Microbispora sp. H10830 TaxID=2729109 RepID=UPI001601795B|nr:hypothetical protein [Microbispora sp. H10830]
MHRSIRHLLGLAAASAIVACGLPAFTSTAHAADDLSADWGPVYSDYYGNGRAMARGRVWDNEDNDSFNFEARLYDRNSPARLCGYLHMRIDTDGELWEPTIKKCGPAGFTPFTIKAWEEDIPDSIRVRVCYWDTGTRTVTSCGKWRYAYRKVG